MYVSIMLYNIMYINENLIFVERLNVRKIVKVYVNLFSLKRKCFKLFLEICTIFITYIFI